MGVDEFCLMALEFELMPPQLLQFPSVTVRAHASVQVVGVGGG